MIWNLFGFSKGFNPLSLEEFKILFDDLYVPIKNFIYYKVGDVALAEDIAQDVFVKLWEKRKDIEKGKVKSLLYTIANNLTMNHFNHQSVVLNFERSYSPGISESPQFVLETKEFDDLLQRTISAIPEKSREVFLMNRIDKLTYKEIAKRLEIGEKAVEKRMHKAIELLKDKIGHKI